MHSAPEKGITFNSLASAFISCVKKTPEKTAVRHKNKSLSYHLLDEISTYIAHVISRHIPLGKKNPSILLCLERDELAIAAILACVKMGITYIPFDPRNPDERLHYMLKDCSPLLMITNKKEEKRQSLCPEIYLEDIPVHTGETLPLLPETTGQEPAYIMYTSGSTGEPKGVIVPQQGILRLALNGEPFQFPAQAVVAQCGNIAFDASTLEIWGALLNGATLVVVPYDTVIDSEALAALLRSEKVTDAFFTVALFNQLVTENPGVFGTLNNVLTGGDALSPKAVHAALCSATPPGAVWNCYGPTENTVVTTFHRVSREESLRSSIPIGRAIAGSQCYVLDENRRPVAQGEEGELYTSGVGLAAGYLNKPDKTAEAFLPNPFYPQERVQTPHSASAIMYKTGDRVRMLADGSLDFVGRVDNQVKIRGFRLEPGEVEHQLCLIDGVELAIVTVVEHQGQKKLAAWCKSNLEANAILRKMQQQAPAYMVPSSLQVLEQLPLTPNGKVDKRSLPVPQFISELSTPAETATERWLSDIWQQLLALPHPAGREDHFFSLGGHSLLVVKLKQRIQAASGKVVSLTELFRCPLLADMAACIDAQPVVGAETAIARVTPGEKVPLSDEQKRLWLICRREPHLPHYSIPLAFRLSGELDPERLAQALDTLCQRHESLRLRIYSTDGVPWQQAADSSPALIMEEVQDEHALQEKVRQEVQRPFLFGDDPLLRMRLYRVPGQPWLLLINIHHVITDGWSMGVFFRELSALYAGDERLAPLECQFTDYCAWQQTQDHSTDLAYWQQQLKEVTPQQLPISGKGTGHTVTRSQTLSPALHTQLKEMAVQCRTGLFTLTSSALAILLSRLCHQQDVQISSIWANRRHQALADQIGFFANTLILRMQVDPERPLLDWLKENHTRVTEGFQHGAAPLGEVLAQCGVSPAGNQHPLCSVLLVLQNTDGGDGTGLALAGCDVTPCPLPDEQAKSDLLMMIVPEPDGGLRVDATFRDGGWPEALMNSLLAAYQQILTAMTENLHQTVAATMTVDAAMRRQQLIGWNPPVRAPQAGTVLSWFDHQVEARPDAPAVTDDHHAFSYRALNARADHLAAQLQQRAGELHGKRVAFALERTADTITLILAILKLGAVYVPFDPAHPDERLHYILEDCAAACLVTEAAHRHRQSLCPEYDLADLLAAPAPAVMPAFKPAHHPEEVAYIMYTSGSTGAPKGVEVLHQGIVRLVIDADPYQVGPDAVMAQAGNIAFDASTLEIWGALLNGAQLAVIPYHTVIDREALPAALKKHRVTDAWFTVALFNQLAGEDPAVFGGLKNLLIGGDALNPTLVGAVMASATPPAQIWNGYGPTENTTFTTLHRITLEDCRKEAIPIGRPIAGTTCYVLDEQRRLLPPGVPGELYTSGLGLAKGYLNKPETTAETFIPNPFRHEGAGHTAATGRMYKTGDRVRWTEHGTLDFLGRVDNQVKIRGYRLEPGEVEHRLCALEGVSQAVVGVQTVNDQKQLVAWCVSDAPADEILRAFRQCVPAYMVPACVQVIEAMPLTPNGKVDKKRLPAPDFSAADSGKTLPQGETEQQIAEIWQQLLQTDRPCCREDNFFMIGGHSLLVIKMTDLISRQMGKTLSVAEVFSSESLAELAACFEGGQVSHDEEETRLIAQDSRLTLTGFVSAPDVALKEVLLTGATGFLGIHLLATLQQRLPGATVHCLVRGEDGPARLRQTAARYQITLDEQRVSWVYGDLGQPRLGLDAQAWQRLADGIDAVYHCGAWVNHLHRYSTLRAANVVSTLDLLALCTQGTPKQFFYVSTLSAAARQGDRYLEQTLADAPPMKNGYVQSKWVCEQLLTQAFANGLHGAVYRMGNITGSTQNGISNVESNHTLNLIKGCLQQGVAPAWPGYQLDISPVDILAGLLVGSSIERTALNRVFNLGYLSAVPWRDLLTEVAGAGYPLRFVSGETWATEWVPLVSSDNALYPFKSFYLTPQAPACEEVEHSLAAGSIDVQALLRIYIRYWLASGFLTQPVVTAA